MTNDPPVRLILDRSALVAYAVHRSVHVGETLHEVIDDDVNFGVPVIVAMEALTRTSGKDRALLHQLLALDACVLLPELPEDLLELTYWRDVTGRPDLAAAAHAVHAHDASVLTSEWSRYGGNVPLIHLPA